MKKLSLLLLAACVLTTQQLDAAESELTWHSDYGTAFAAAKRQAGMLLVYFEDSADAVNSKTFNATLADPQVQQLCRDYVLLRVPTSYEVTVGGTTTRLLSHGAFAALQGRAGLAVIDLQDADSQHYGQTVSAVPFGRRHYYSPNFAGPQAVRTLLELPAGSITQRSMVFAVRLHPENPASTRGRAEPYLFTECRGHCAYQARIRVQGHQGFEARFHRINARIGGNGAKEVVAESWSGEGMLAACFSCVHSWRQSPGHWDAVRSTHRAYGYDIRRGGNGIWYGTGLFGG